MSRFLFGCGIRLLPKNLFSRWMGVLARQNRPRRLVLWAIRQFAAHFKVDVNESERALEEFSTFQAFFTRSLKKEARRVDSHFDAIVSPCDGALGACGHIEDGRALQIKGRSYSVQALLGGKNPPSAGQYATIYLSPKDYHRFHAPFDLEIVSSQHIPGHLWPVNPWAVEHVDELFCKNERIVLACRPFGAEHVGHESAYILPVGATVVGKIKIFEALQNRYKKGEEMGCFELGSTIVMILPQTMGKFSMPAFGGSIRMGQRVGMLSLDHGTKESGTRKD